MPNFLIIGAQKAGTTALYHYLRQHPEVYMSPVKEPLFFSFESERPNFRGPRDQEILNDIVVSDVEAYGALFREAREEKAVGEASAIYIYDRNAPERIRGHVPDARLIAVLRDPAERAYSSFLHTTRDGREPIADFGQALDAEEERIRSGWAPIWHYKNAGFYHAQLSRYYKVFDRERIRVYLYEDLNLDSPGVLRDAYGFLGVDTSFVPDVSARHNVSGMPKNERLHALHGFLLRPHPVKSVFKPFLSKRLRRRLVAGVVDALRNRNLVKPPFPQEVRRRLVEEYREDVQRLQHLIGRDLSAWLR